VFKGPVPKPVKTSATTATGPMGNWTSDAVIQNWVYQPVAVLKIVIFIITGYNRS
jgi:hypothetical protein